MVIDEHGIILKLLPDLATVEGQQEILAMIQPRGGIIGITPENTPGHL